MLPIKQLLPSLEPAREDQFQRDKCSLMKNLNNTYKPICFDEFNINPYPLLFDKDLMYQINDCHDLLVEAIHKIVIHFFCDSALQEIISLNDTTLNLLRPLKNKTYEIGAIRPDFLFDKNYQLKICEINARFPLNTFMFLQCISVAMRKQFIDKSSYFEKKLRKNSEIFKQFFDCSQPIYLFFDKEKSFDVFLFKNILEKTLPNIQIKQITPSEGFKNKLFSQEEKHCFQVILNLRQEELFTLESSLLKKITKHTYFNDLRTILLVHDKRLLSILSNKAIMSKYISSEKCNRLASYIIPTYRLDDNTMLNIKTNPQNWVLKKISTGKGEGMYVGKEAQIAEILTVLNEEKNDYIAQPFIDQPLFRFLNDSSKNREKRCSDYQTMYLVGSILSFNSRLLGPGVLRGSHKTIINVAQGEATVFMPIY